MHGTQIKVEQHGGQPNIGFWDRADEWASWKVRFTQPGTFEVKASLSTVHQDAAFVVEIDGQKLTGVAPRTGDWGKFQEISIGKIEIKTPGEYELKVTSRDLKTWKAINLRYILLTRN